MTTKNMSAQVSNARPKAVSKVKPKADGALAIIEADHYGCFFG